MSSSSSSSSASPLYTTVTKDGTLVHTQSVGSSKTNSNTHSSSSSTFGQLQSYSGKSLGSTVVEAAHRSNMNKPQGEETIGYALDDILTPMERSIKTYLTNSVSEDLITLLSIMAVERPPDPHLWLAQRLLEKGPHAGLYLVVKRADGSPRTKLTIAKDIEEGTVRPQQTEVDTTGTGSIVIGNHQSEGHPLENEER